MPIISLRYIAAVLMTLFLFVSCSEKKSELSEGASAPKLSIGDIRNGQTVDVSLLRNKIVLVNFWASWCMPCKEEMPSIEALHRDMINNDRFVMVTILYKDSPAAATDYMRANGYTFPVFVDLNDSSARNFGVTGVPETYIIDKKGMLRKRVIGPADWNSPDAKNYINTLISE
jgi:thiol-disulfide isomerase/thioredoxin